MNSTYERSPCYGCAERCKGCHGKCAEYREWSEWRCAVNAAERPPITDAFGRIRARRAVHEDRVRRNRYFGGNGSKEL